MALFVLSLLGVAACAFGPFYERAVEAAQLRSTLGFAAVADRGLSVRAGSSGSVDPLLPTGRLRSLYGAAVRSTTLNVGFGSVNGTIVYRAGQCAHLRMVTGMCPTTLGGVAASTSSAAALHLSVGSHVAISSVGLSPNPDLNTPPRPLVLTVVGLYSPFDPSQDYWFGHPYSSAAGISITGGTTSGQQTADAFFARSGFPADLGPYLPPSGKASVLQSADLPLRVDRVGLDDLPLLRDGLAALATQDKAAEDGTIVQTDLAPFLLDQVDEGRHQAKAIIPAFAAELALLLLVVIGIVVVAAADQRQQDFALARLRGYSSGQAARLFDQEFGVLVLLSIVPGMAVSYAMCAAAGRWWLSGRASPELRWPVLAATASVAAAALLIVVWVARRTAARPVHDLLRRVPHRASRRGLGAVEAAAAAAAVAGVVVLLSGAHDNPLAVITPGLLALVVGLVLSRAVGVLAQVIGRLAMWRGQLAIGMAGLQVARRPGIRRVVVLLCVAAALIVSAVDQWSVSERNRSVRAQVEAGAPVVLTVRAGTAATLDKAVTAADPTGRYATPVIRQIPPTAAPVFAVDPAAFTGIVGWGWPHDRPPSYLLTRLNPPRPAPISYTGSVVQLRLRDLSLTRRAAPENVQGTPGPVYLLLNGVRADGTAVSTRLGPLPEGTGRDAALTEPVPCGAGCRMTQIALLRTTSDTDSITIDGQITGLSAGTPGRMRPVPLGPATNWAETTPETPTVDGHPQRIRLTAAGAGLRLQIANSTAPAVMQHLDVPITVPAVTAGDTGLEPNSRGDLTDNNVDGITAQFTPVGSLPLIPGAGGPALLVDRQVADLIATPSLQGSSTEVWLGRNDPARERALIATLAAHGVDVLSRDTTARHAAALSASAPAWAMQLALVTTALAVLIAGLVIVMAATTSRRSRTYDASVMSLVGVHRATLRRVALVEQLAAALLAVLVGAAIGVLGAHLALPAIPIFVQEAPVPSVLLPIPWSRVILAALAALVVLGAVTVVVAWLLVRQIGPARLREAQQ